MQILWKIKKGFVKDVIAEMDEPKSPYNTISSVIRILEKKGFVTHKAYGKTHEYYPKISKLAYKKKSFQVFLKDYFGGSYKKVVSHLVEENELSADELNEMLSIIQKAEENK